MDCNWLKHNSFIIQNGKLVPRPNTPEKKKNYRYIHYDPFTNPEPEDYYRETISRLQKENGLLRNDLASKLEEEQAKLLMHASGDHREQIHKYQSQIAALKSELLSKQRQINQKNNQLVNKDKQILQMSNQNTKLHLRINSVVKQIQSLNKVMSRKDEQIMNKKSQLQEYCKTLEKLTAKEKQDEKTMFSQNEMMTPKIEEKVSEEDDSFASVEYSSVTDRNMTMDRRYMTPQVQTLKIQDLSQYAQRAHQQRRVQPKLFSMTPGPYGLRFYN